jgi:hypothetical protein
VEKITDLLAPELERAASNGFDRATGQQLRRVVAKTLGENA